MVSAYDFADRIRQGSYVAYALCGCIDAGHVEFESVEFACIHAMFSRFLHVNGVGCGNFSGTRVECVRDDVEKLVFTLRVGLGKLRLRDSCGVGFGAHSVEHVGFHSVGLSLWVRHSFLD